MTAEPWTDSESVLTARAELKAYDASRAKNETAQARRHVLAAAVALLRAYRALSPTPPAKTQPAPEKGRLLRFWNAAQKAKSAFQETNLP